MRWSATTGGIKCLSRRLWFPTRYHRWEVTRRSALPCLDLLTVLEAGQLAHDDLSVRYQAGKVVTNSSERHTYLLGDLQVESLPMFFQALQNFAHS